MTRRIHPSGPDWYESVADDLAAAMTDVHRALWASNDPKFMYLVPNVLAEYDIEFGDTPTRECA